MKDAPLDMRMDKDAPLSARDVVNTYSEAELFRIIKEYGEERFAKNIARRICAEREQNPIETTLQLAQIIIKAIPAKYRSGKIFNFFAEVLSDQRATNVSQAINLYENEQRNQKMEAMQQKQLEKIEQLTRENAAIKAELNRRQ